MHFELALVKCLICCLVPHILFRLHFFKKTAFTYSFFLSFYRNFPFSTLHDDFYEQVYDYQLFSSSYDALWDTLTPQYGT